MNWINSTKLRHDLTDVLAQLSQQEEPLFIIHRSEPIGVLLSHAKYVALLVDLKLLRQQLEGCRTAWEDAEDLLLIEELKNEPTISIEEAIAKLEEVQV